MTSAATLTDPEEPTYTVGLSGFVFDNVMFANVFLDTVLAPIRRSFGPVDAMTIAGCHVKSIEVEDTPGARFPKHFAKIQSYRAATKTDPGRVVLLGKGPIDKPYVWLGTVAEYEKTWECD